MEIKSEKDVQINYHRKSKFGHDSFASRDFIIYLNPLILLCETEENKERLVFYQKNKKMTRFFIRKLTCYDSVKSSGI